MKAYKYITVPSDIVLEGDVTIDKAVASIYDVIKAESENGWELVGVAPGVVRTKKRKDVKNGSAVNTLIFAKEG